MINHKNVNELVEETRAYLEARIEYTKLHLVEESSDNFAKLMAAFIIGGIALIFMITLSFFIGIALSELWESHTLGFGVVAAFYLLLLLTLVIFRKQLLKLPLQNAAIKSYFNHENKD